MLRTSAYLLGLAAQFAVGTFVFGTGYALALVLLRAGPDVYTGAILGLLHGVLVGLVLPLVEHVDPGMRSGRTPAPGLFALHYGWLAAVGLVAVHVVYGVIFGLTYRINGDSISLAHAWLSGLLATIGLTVLVEGARLLRISDASTVVMQATSIDVVMEDLRHHRHSPRTTA